MNGNANDAITQVYLIINYVGFAKHKNFMFLNNNWQKNKIIYAESA